MQKPSARAQRFLRLPAVCERVGLGRAALYQRIATNRFPKPVLLSTRCAVWPEAEIDQWIEEQIQRRNDAA